MSYVDAYLDKKTNLIKVVERVNNKRIYVDYAPDYSFYVKAASGKFKSLFDDPLQKISPSNYDEFRKLSSTHSKNSLFESDVNQVLRCLEQNYKGKQSPKMQVAFFDIETDFDKELGFSEPGDAFNPITSIAVYLQWMDQMVCLAVPPKTLNMSEAEEMADRVGDVILFTKESDMLKAFLDLISDSDIISGWNSDYYDIPYIVNRISRVLGRHENRKLCLWNQSPRKKTVEKFGNKEEMYSLVGRLSLDYMELYKKYNFEPRHSNSLDNIAEVELGEKKVAYDGTLDQLYNNDFELFLKYNIQDTLLLHKLDLKLKFISLVSEIAHTNCALVPNALGTVTLVDQAVMVKAHEHNLIMPNRGRDNEKGFGAAGGWVQEPVKGLHNWVGSADLNSLYPSIIRTFNISPETIVGQVSLENTNRSLTEYINDANKDHTFAEWWNDRFHTLEMASFFENKEDDQLSIQFEGSNTSERKSVRSIKRLLEQTDMCITANGTLLRTDKQGIIPNILSSWYTERKRLQKLAANIARVKSQEFKCKYDIAINRQPDIESVYHFKLEELEETLSLKNPEITQTYFERWGLYSDNGVVKIQEGWKRLWDDANQYWDTQQLTRKILLNSAYGALLNEHSRLFDRRMGQSITLSGRMITRHMTAKTNEFIAGEYDYCGASVVAGDTDSIVGDSLIHTNEGTKTIEDLFNAAPTKTQDGEKEYALNDDLQVASYSQADDKMFYGNINFIYRHKVDKDLYEVEDELGNKVTVTNDHSLMVERDGEFMECRATELKENDVMISLDGDELKLRRSKVKKVTKVSTNEDAYVYDIGMKRENCPYFFGNNILVHNSTYFSAWPIIKDEVKSGNIEWNKDIAIQVYDDISKSVSDSFPEFLKETFNVPLSNGVWMKSGREIVATNALFVKKKKYACLVFDNEGKRQDIDGKAGKLKVMGLEIKRSDTSKLIQEFLEGVLWDVLLDKPFNEVADKVVSFKQEFIKMDPWMMGSPKGANKITHYKELEEKYLKSLGSKRVRKKPKVPGHVRAAINWNMLRELNNDQHSLEIKNGQKLIVCKLKGKNPHKLESIALPTDEIHIPEWFKELDFDTDAMMKAVVDKKLENLLSVTDFDFSKIDITRLHLNSLFY